MCLRADVYVFYKQVVIKHRSKLSVSYLIPHLGLKLPLEYRPQLVQYRMLLMFLVSWLTWRWKVRYSCNAGQKREKELAYDINKNQFSHFLL